VVEIGFNGSTVGRAEWDGQADYLFEGDVPAELIQPSGNVLTVGVVRRNETVNGKDRLLVDVAMIDWIELDFAHKGVLDSPGEYLVKETVSGSVVELPAVHGGGVAATDDGQWFDARSLSSAEDTVRFELSSGTTGLVFATNDTIRAPDRIVVDRPSDLRSSENAAEYIIIVHRSLREAIRPLAEFHRANGLKTVVVDVEDVYDEFNHGILHPRAIRSFVQHAYEQWQEPRLRFLLLVGDASWDLRNPDAVDTNYSDMVFAPSRRHAGLPRIPITPYETHADENHRNLIPTWNAMTYDGYAASDSWFACLDDDYLPDLAIGRIPVVTPEEVEAVVEKTLAYARSSSSGPWLRSLLLITNESVGFQRSSDRLAQALRADGFRSEKIYPQASEEDNALNTKSILEEWNDGKWAVSFLGHGGRFIWRTGPPDYRKNHDLFTLDDLDKLEPSTDLPIVLALTCYSAPFDHPNADSIGEKLLRMPERGSVAVFAASWRNSPSPTMGQIVLEELNVPRTTVGEAILRAKHEIRNRTLVEQYNLLGDPALPVQQPRQKARVEVRERAGFLRLEGNVLSAREFSGNVRIEWLDSDGESLRVDELDLDRPVFTTEYPIDTSAVELPAAVTVFAWDDTAGVAASGYTAIERSDESTRAALRSPDKRPAGERPADTSVN
jgi:hypothetical protein